MTGAFRMHSETSHSRKTLLVSNLVCLVLPGYPILVVYSQNVLFKPLVSRWCPCEVNGSDRCQSASRQATIQMLELCRFFGNAARPAAQPRLFASFLKLQKRLVFDLGADGIFVSNFRGDVNLGCVDTITHHIVSIGNGASGVIMCASSQ